jgi:hypothetical protein
MRINIRNSNTKVRCSFHSQIHGIETLFQLIVAHLVKKFPIFYGTQRFIIIFTISRHRTHSEKKTDSNLQQTSSRSSRRFSVTEAVKRNLSQCEAHCNVLSRLAFYCECLLNLYCTPRLQDHPLPDFHIPPITGYDDPFEGVGVCDDFCLRSM